MRYVPQALESLSSTPGAQLSRLRLLYTDLFTAVAPLIPSSHPIMSTLSNPLSPTSSPLRSAAGHLRVLLSVLRERCAPIRDGDIDELLQRLDDPPFHELPKACIATTRGILDVADRMKNDLADFVVGTWTELDARRWLSHEAIERERRTVRELFSLQTIKTLYRDWLGLGSEENSKAIIARLMKALGSSEPVSSFPPSNNPLPPPFIFTAFDLVQVQNLLQALVIAASLRTLVRPVNPVSDWLSRIWTLLELEVQRGGTEPAETKVLNLEDEVVQAAKSSEDPDVEVRLREAVRRILRPQDPVFVLLRSRLLNAIQARLGEETVPSTYVPTRLRSGLGSQLETESNEQPQERELLVKGFEDVILKENIKVVVIMIRKCLAWVEEAWGEILHSENAL
jgi:T-complex protein 11